MGIYETVYNCGDGHYCVAIWSTLDPGDTRSTWYYCDKHKNLPGIFCFDTFCRRYCKNDRQKLSCISTKVEVVNTVRNARQQTINQYLLHDVDLTEYELVESRKIIFSELDDAPAWQATNDSRAWRIVVPEQEVSYDSSHPGSPQDTSEQVQWNWLRCKVEEFPGMPAIRRVFGEDTKLPGWVFFEESCDEEALAKLRDLVATMHLSATQQRAVIERVSQRTVVFHDRAKCNPLRGHSDTTFLRPEFRLVDNTFVVLESPITALCEKVELTDIFNG